MTLARSLAVLVLLAGLPARSADAPKTLDDVVPVRGFCIAAPSPRGLDAFVTFIEQELASRQVNTLILRVDFNFQYASRPELADPHGLSKADAARIVAACRAHRIRVIPQVNLLGHQSWAGHTGRLLQAHPEFDETPWVAMPDDYKWPNPDGLYCKSYCPQHPEVHDVVFAVVDEVCDAFEADAFHAGMDEVFYIGMEKCPRCGGQDRSKLFADEVTRIRDHLAAKDRRLWIWADRLIDGKTTGLGEWEASENDTHRAIEMIPKDVVLCDWHYERPSPTTVALALAGFDVVACPWKNGGSAVAQLEDVVRNRAASSHETRDHLKGVVQTIWSGADGFLEEYAGHRPARGRGAQSVNTESNCFRTLFDAVGRLDPAWTDPARPRKRLLVLGQSKGYQHEAVSTAMARLYDLGRSTGLWDATLRTDCANITKKPLKWEVSNLDQFDAVVFFTDGELDMDASQKADLMAFVKEDGKGLLALHSATLTFPSWPEFGQMLGGRFDGHPWGQLDAPLVVEASDFPGFDRLPSRFTLRDEIHQIKDFGADDVRVLLRLDSEKVDLTRNGVHSPGPAGFPVAWARTFGKGRVMYNGLGHTRDVWERPEYEPMWVDSIRWILGLVTGDVTPRREVGSQP
jgi:type 1 glutamine amidotransferase